MKRGLLLWGCLLVALGAAAEFATAKEMPAPFWPEVEEVYNTRPVENQVVAGKNATVVTGLFNEVSGRPVRVAGGWEGVQLSNNPDLEEVLRFIDSHQETFGVHSDELEVLHFGKVMGKTYLTARQLLDGRPVLESRVILRIAGNGKIAMWGADVETGDALDLRWSSTISADIAASNLATYSGLSNYEIEQVREVWLRESGLLVPVYDVRIQTDKPWEKPHGLLEAASGETMGFYNRVNKNEVDMTIRGPIKPYQIQDDDVIMPLPNQNFTIQGTAESTDASGHANFTRYETGEDVSIEMRLDGLYAYVTVQDGESGEFNTSVEAPFTGNFDWIPGEHARADEINVYYHVNFIHDFFVELDPEFEAWHLDHMQVNVNMGGSWADNAFSSGNYLGFGHGAATFHNLAMFSDVIYHEYTHSVTGVIYENGHLPYSGQSGAMNEAWSDYFPCSIHDNPGMSRGIYRNGSITTPMRSLDNNRRYPENLVHEVHSDGLIMGGCLWHMREELGDARLSDSLAHFARYGLASDFNSYFQEVLVADDDDGDLTNGTPNGRAIYRGFGRHGVGPGDAPNLLVKDVAFNEFGEEEDIFLAGERVELAFALENDVTLYPPAAQNVTISLSASDAITFEQTTVTLGSIGPREEAALATPIAFTVVDDVHPHYEWIRLDIEANDGAYTNADSIRINVGTPSILLVDDGDEKSYNNAYIDVLWKIGTNSKNVKTEDGEVDLDGLSDYPIVIWYTGDKASPMTSPEAEALVDYVSNGGKLILTGQHIGRQLPTYSELRSMVGVESYVDARSEYGGMGYDDEPLSAGKRFAFLGYDGFQTNQVGHNGVIPTADAHSLYHYFEDEAVAAVYTIHENNGMAFYFAFGLEGVGNVTQTAHANDILEPVLRYMGADLDASEGKPSAVAAIPVDFSLEAPYPNPFNPSTTIDYSIPAAGNVRLSVYNILGREILTLVDGFRDSGKYKIALDMRDFASGTYFIRLKAPQGVLHKRAVLMK